jgi:hypothetical protein
MFANKNSGGLEGFLGTIYYPDRESAQSALDRVTQMTRAGSAVTCRNRSKAKSSDTPMGGSISGPSSGSDLI